MIQWALPSRKHFGKVNEKPGTVSSALVKCPWWKVPPHAGGVCKHPLAKANCRVWCANGWRTTVQLASYLSEEWCGCLCHQHHSQAAWAPLWLCTLVAEASLLQGCPLASLQEKGMPQPFLNCRSKNYFSAATSGQMTHVGASPGNTASLQHTSSFRPQALGAAWSMVWSAGHSWDPPRRWRLPTAVSIPPHWHKDIPVSPRVLHSSGKKQDDHQELPDSMLTTATCSSPAHPGGSVQRKWNSSLWRQDCFRCQKGRTNHCLYIWNCHVLHLELKTTLPWPQFCCFPWSRTHLCNPPALLRQGQLSEFFSGVVNSLQESETSSFSNYLVTKSVLAMLGKRSGDLPSIPFSVWSQMRHSLSIPWLQLQSFLTNSQSVKEKRHLLPAVLGMETQPYVSR